MKIVREELSLGREATADATVLNSPDVVVPARTMTEPEGGVVRVAARTAWQNDRAMTRDERRVYMFLYVAARFEIYQVRCMLL